MLKFKIKYITLFLSLCLGLSFSVQAQKTKKLNAALVAGADVGSDFILSQDGSMVIYRADQNQDNLLDLYFVAADGSAEAIKITKNMQMNQNPILDFALSADGTNLVFLTNQTSTGTAAIYTVFLDYTIPTNIEPSLLVSRTISNFLLTEDGTKIIYRVAQNEGNTFELYAIDFGGGAPIKISGDLVENGNVEADFILSKDGSMVIYRADQEINRLTELYLASTSQNNVRKISGDYVWTADVKDFVLSENGEKVVYLADQDKDEVYELYVVYLENSSKPIKISGDLVAGGDVMLDFVLSKDGNKVVYLADQDTDQVFELYSVSLFPDGINTPIKISGDLVENGDVFSPFVLNNEGKVVYLADQDTDNVLELYVTSPTGNMPIKISGNLAKDVQVIDPHLSFDGTQVFYRTSQGKKRRFEFYYVPIDASKNPKKINPSLAKGGSVKFDFLISHDNTKVIYWADQDTDDVFELYSFALKTKISNPNNKNNKTLTTMGANQSNLLMENDKNQLVILYPNPATNFIAIRLSDMLDANYFLVDVFGKLLFKGKLSKGQASINLKDLSTGAYFIRISDGNKEITKKFIKN